MKKLILIIPIFVLLSCSVQKRKYQKGFYVSQKLKIKSQRSEVGSQPQEKVYASADENLEIIKPQQKNYLLNENDTCDVILFKDGKEERVKIIEILPKEIKYKRCDLPSGPLYTVLKSDIDLLKYSNGTSEIFKVEAETSHSYNNNARDNDCVKKKEIKPKHPKANWVQTYGIVSLATLLIGMFMTLIVTILSYGTAGLGLFWLTLAATIIFGFIAVSLGERTLKEIKQNPDKYRGKVPTTIGLIMGSIGMGIAAIIALIMFAAM